MSAEDIFDGGFEVPDSVTRALAQMAGEPLPRKAPQPGLIEAYEQERRVAEPEPEGVWLTFHDVDSGGRVSEVQIHRSELEALRAAVNGDDLTARFLVFGERLEDVL